MARNIYSFVKIEKRQTRKGIYAAAAGAASMVCLVVMMMASSVRGGGLPPAAGAIGYLSFAVAAAGLWSSIRLRKDTEAYGKMVHGALYVNIAAIILHVLIFVLGCLSIII